MFFFTDDPNGYLTYEEPLFRPPREHDSLIVQATVGCSRNSCAFCVMYKNKKFRIRDMNQIEGDLSKIPVHIRPRIVKIFLADGNALCAGASHLTGICRTAREIFPNLRHISTYANPYDILEISRSELSTLRKAGLKNLYVGLESGADRVLATIGKKGCYKDYLESMNRAHEAGFVLSVTLLLGLGGKNMSGVHSSESARLVSEAAPRFVNTLTTTFYEGSGLLKLYNCGELEFQSPGDIIDEHIRFVNEVESERMIYRSNHVSNFMNIEGILKRDRSVISSALESLKAEIENNNKFNKLKVGGYHEI